jgi:homoserine O-acetyltransferase/O-succinyltransferase
MVRAQAMLLDHLGIETLFCVIGGSMGGMQVLQWAASYPDRVFAALPIACAHAAFGAEHRLPRGRPPGDHGRSRLARRRYFAEQARNPRARARGRAHGRAHHLSVGRGAAPQIRPQLQDRDNPTFSFDADFQVESYLRHQGITFVERFDANSYLYMTRAMDYFDLAADYGGVLANAFRGTRRASASSRSPATGCSRRRNPRHRACAERRRRAQCRSSRSTTDKGHDAFLLDEPELFTTCAASSTARRARGLKPARR